MEPIFAVAFVKNVLDGKRLTEVNPYFEDIAKERGFYNTELMEEVARTGSVQGIDIVPDDVKVLFKTALEIGYETHVRMQAAFQAHTDLAVSKTINMPNKASKDDIEYAYWTAFQTKCKGITIYRDGSKPTQVLEIPTTGMKPAPATEQQPPKGLIPRERPRAMRGITERIRTGHGNMYITINFDQENKPFEVFSTLGKAGGCESASLEAISRLTSLALRSGVDPNQIVDQMRGISCIPAWDQGVLVGSPADAVTLAMERHITGSPRGKIFAAQLGLGGDTEQLAYTKSEPKGVGNGNGHNKTHGSGVRCPECNTDLIFQEGCLACLSCGWNKCE